MAKKPKMGSDPLSWIKDSRKSKPSKQKLHRLPDKSGSTREITSKTSQAGLNEGWSRATFIMREEFIEKVKALAYWDREEIKEVIDKIFKGYFRNKKIKPKH